MTEHAPPDALGYATRLLEHFVAEHFPANTDWKARPDLMGVLTQLDNAITITRDFKAEAQKYKAILASDTVQSAAMKALNERLEYYAELESRNDLTDLGKHAKLAIQNLKLDIEYAITSNESTNRCAKCGCETKGEEALVGGEIWCHPCADECSITTPGESR